MSALRHADPLALLAECWQLAALAGVQQPLATARRFTRAALRGRLTITLNGGRAWRLPSMQWPDGFALVPATCGGG